MTESNNDLNKPWYVGTNESGANIPTENVAVFGPESGAVMTKLAIDSQIKIWADTPELVALGKWRALAILNQEYKSLSFRRLMLQMASRELTDDWTTVTNRMAAVDEVAREISKELMGREL